MRRGLRHAIDDSLQRPVHCRPIAAPSGLSLALSLAKRGRVGTETRVGFDRLFRNAGCDGLLAAAGSRPRSAGAGMVEGAWGTMGVLHGSSEGEEERRRNAAGGGV